jgi:hypothetical protein
MRVSWSFDVRVPIDAVFEYYRDPVRSLLRDVPTFEVVGDGDFLRRAPMRIRGSGLKNDWVAQLIDNDPPQRIVVRVWPDGAAKPSVVWTHEFAASKGGTAVTASVEGPTSRGAELFFVIAHPFELLARRRWARRQASAIVGAYAANQI